MKALLAVLAFLGAFVGAMPAGQAAIVYQSTFAPEAFGATGSGSVTLTYDEIPHTLGISATWSGLSGTTTIAHIHCCTSVPGAGTVAVAVTPGTLPSFPVGVTAGTYTTLLDLTQLGTYTPGFVAASGGTVAGAESRLVAGLSAGTAYFNIHTTLFPGGELRGFPAQVPAPGTLALVGLAFLGLTLRRHRAG